MAPEEMEKTIFKAAKTGDLEMVQKILDQDPSYATFQDKTRSQIPLHVAGSAAVVDLLLEKGANVNAKDRFQWTPLHQAENEEVAKVLLENGADVYAETVKKENTSSHGQNRRGGRFGNQQGW